MVDKIAELDILKLFDCDNHHPTHYLKLAESSARNGLTEDCNSYLLLAQASNQIRNYEQLKGFKSRKVISYIIEPEKFYGERKRILGLLEKKLKIY